MAASTAVPQRWQFTANKRASHSVLATQVEKEAAQLAIRVAVVRLRSVTHFVEGRVRNVDEAIGDERALRMDATTTARRERQSAPIGMVSRARAQGAPGSGTGR